MKSEEIRQKFLTFFEKRDHTIIASAPLVPENDPSVLFTTAGMQPLVPYLLGEPHPQGKRLANYQKCVRTNDLDEVGDKTHLTFFEMLGNWSLGDYFKRETLKWSYQLLTDTEEGFGLDPNRLYVTVFAGGEAAPADEDSAEILKEIGVPESRIYYLDDNWWPAPDPEDTASGPTGPDAEFFYDTTEEGLGEMTHDEFETADDRQDVVEIWNNVFMEYKKEEGKIVDKLDQQNVDTGMGFERITSVLQGVDNVFDTDLFQPIMRTIEIESTRMEPMDPGDKLRTQRIIADHVRASVFMIADGVQPANTDAGYILRRLLRRSVRGADQLGMPHGRLAPAVAGAVIDKYTGVYPYLTTHREAILSAIEAEESKFRATLNEGMKMFDKMAAGTDTISGDDAFKLFSTYGLPIDMVKELAAERGMAVDENGFNSAFKEHQEKSRAGAQEKFKGGLAGSGDIEETKLHTATHLLNAALREVLGEHVYQRGSNITAERLRFDFSHPEKLTDDEKEKVEKWVNDAIQAELPISSQETTVENAKELGAIGVFDERYADTVKVYTIGNEDKGIWSREICGGPHVENTSELGTFRIKKEESVSAGVRRIKGVLE